MADNFSPKQRFAVVMTGKVVSDVFETEFQKKVGTEFLKDGKAYAYNVEVPLENAPPVVLQLVTKDRPNPGDMVDFPLSLEMFLKSKYTIRAPVVFRGVATEGEAQIGRKGRKAD